MNNFLNTSEMKDNEIQPGDWFFIGDDLVVIIEITASGVHCSRSITLRDGYTFEKFKTYTHQFVAEQKTYRAKP